jgi:AcrR family transcriptional regulator
MEETGQEATTKQKILDAAERLFADLGFRGTSLRMIVTEAGVNLAAVNYHFGSKDGLLEAVVARRAGPVNEERAAMLDEAEREAGGPAPLEKVLAAFLVPPFRLRQDPARGCMLFPRVMARLQADGGELVSRVLQKHFGEILVRFIQAVHAAVPELSSVELYWRWHLAIGAMVHALSLSATDLQKIIGVLQQKITGSFEDEGKDVTVERVVEFVAAGFRAPTHSRSSK